MEVDTKPINLTRPTTTTLSSIAQPDNLNFQKFVDGLILPGMILQLTLPTIEKSISWSIGPGLALIPTTRLMHCAGKQTSDSILIQQFGILRHKITSKPASNEPKVRRTKFPTQEHHVWIERLISAACTTTLLPLCRATIRCHANQFQVDDRVIGIVLAKQGENYNVDIGCATPASLSYLSFEGASKKNRPDMHAGDVVYAVITRVDRDLEIELSCVDEAGKASGMGILGRHEPGTVGNAGGMAGGVMLHCSQDLIRRLANQDEFPLLQLLAKVYPFEVCLGANGRIWLTARCPRETMILSNAIAMADHISATQCCQLAKELC